MCESLRPAERCSRSLRQLVAVQHVTGCHSSQLRSNGLGNHGPLVVVERLLAGGGLGDAPHVKVGFGQPMQQFGEGLGQFPRRLEFGASLFLKRTTVACAGAIRDMASPVGLPAGTPQWGGDRNRRCAVGRWSKQFALLGTVCWAVGALAAPITKLREGLPIVVAEYDFRRFFVSGRPSPCRAVATSRRCGTLGC